MPQDLFQIALEHHRSGRYRQAEAGYRDVLAFEPDHLDAAHWLGVLIYQAGRAAQATPLLERAAAGRPSDAAFQNNLAQAYLSGGRVDDAIVAFDRALALEPRRPEALLGAAVARLARNRKADVQDALRLLDRARETGLDSADLHQHRGLALLMSGRADEAMDACRAALEKKPDLPEVYHHLGAACRMKGDAEGARMCLTMALQLQPRHARACYGLAVLEAEAGNMQEAERLFRRTLQLKPDSAAAHQGLSQVLRHEGRKKEARQQAAEASRAARSAGQTQRAGGSASLAIAELERKLTPTPEMANLYFRIATRFAVAPPSTLPPDAVVSLFDRYAEHFDEHLRGKLQYRVPELLVEAIAATGPATPLDVLDLGCGTGLCGPLLRPMAGALIGVDLSPAMLDQARERGVYDRLQEGEMVATMLAAPGQFDLIVAADVMIYVGDLAPTFQAAAVALRPGGMLAFSIESTTGDRYTLGATSRRYSHSNSYVQRLAAMYGFEPPTFTPITARIEAKQPVPAYIVLMRLEAQ